MKKIIASLLICILMVAMATGCSTASPTPTENIRITVTPLPTLTPMKFLTTEDKWNYVIENNEAIIYGYEGDLTEVVIPSTIDGYPVTSIDSVGLCRRSRVIIGEAQYVCELTKVTIPASIKNIQTDLFAYSDSLVNVEVEQGSDFKYVNNILYNKDMTILYLCVSKNIESFTIPESVKIIGGGAFRACRKLTSITIPSNVEVIGDNAFYNCSSLKTVTIKEGVKAINNQAFSRCIELEQITIPKSVDAIGYQIVSYTDKITICIYKDSYVESFFKDNDETFGEGSTYMNHVQYVD